MKSHQIIIPLIALLVALTGSIFTQLGMIWYRTLSLPSFAPAGWIIGLVWTTIYILATIAAINVWERLSNEKNFPIIAGMFIANAVINATWTFTFFAAHALVLAAIHALILAISVFFLIWKLYKPLRSAAYLLMPYLAWVLFASYLSFTIASMN